MKTITITITVPDGVEVHVNGGSQQQARPDRPFVERPAPPYPGGVCPEHGVEWNLVPAGYSRNKQNADGSPKRYNAFWSCPERGCNEKPPRPGAEGYGDTSGDGNWQGAADEQLPF